MGRLRPLALGFDSQMSSAFLKSGFQAPAFHEILDDLFCRLGGISGKERFGRMLARGITSQYPLNG